MKETPPTAGARSGSGEGGFVPEIPKRRIDLGGSPGLRGAPRVASAESKRLLVGRDISLSGEITACDTLVVEGTVEATLANSRLLEIADTGSFRGKVQIEEAVIAGLFEGDLVVRNRLMVKSTGRITGSLAVGRLEVELGGEISGTISILGDEANPEEPSTQA